MRRFPLSPRSAPLRSREPARDGETQSDNRLWAIRNDATVYEQGASARNTVLLCDTVTALRAEVAGLRADKAAYGELLNHYESCAWCNPVAAERCDEGARLAELAYVPRARSASGEDASNQQAGRARQEAEGNV